MSVRGWVYVIENQAMPGIVKVGFSTKDPMLRAKELGGTGTPHPFQVVYDALVASPYVVEQAAHTILSPNKEGKEWFRCSRSTAIEAIRQCATEILIERQYLTPDMQGDLGIKNCDFQTCGRPGTKSYKGTHYCALHYELVRKWRFEVARNNR